MSSGAVSYTHLDVYKRQGLDTLIPSSSPKKQAKEKVSEKPEIKEKIVEKVVEKVIKVPEDTKIKITEIEPNREQPRKAFDEDALLELAESIKQFGVLQPLLVQKKEDYYEIIAGDNRKPLIRGWITASKLLER